VWRGTEKKNEDILIARYEAENVFYSSAENGVHGRFVEPTMETFTRNIRAATHITAYWLAFLVALLFVPITSSGEEKGENADDSKSFFALPYIFYTTDTGLGYGAGGMVGYRSLDARPSALVFALTHTTKHQFQSVVKWAHNSTGGRRRLTGEIQYTKFPQAFYGLGNDTSGENPVTYTPEYTQVELALEQSLYRDLKLMSLVQFRNQALVDRGDSGAFLAGGVPWATGRMDGSLGFGVLWDSRDNVTATLRGSLFKIEYFGSLIRNEGGAFSMVTCEAKIFRTPLPDCTLGSMFQFLDARGDVPFYLLPVLGGMERLRGYEMARFVGRNVLLVQEDFRFPIVWRIGGCVFAAAGRVADERRDLLSGGFHVGGGAGLRYFINRKDGMVARLDVAFGDGSSGTYITFGEAF
jgi:hypothetical protein